MGRRDPSNPVAASARRALRGLVTNDGRGAADPRPPRRVARPGLAQSVIDRARLEMEVYLRENAWDEAKPIHLVALYAWCHRQVYEVEPLELDAVSWLGARSAAEKLASECFGGDVEEAVQFMKWVWARERKREQWRRANRGEAGGTRIGWRLMFASRNLVTDYMVDQKRAENP